MPGSGGRQPDPAGSHLHQRCLRPAGNVCSQVAHASGAHADPQQPAFSLRTRCSDDSVFCSPRPHYPSHAPRRLTATTPLSAGLRVSAQGASMVAADLFGQLGDKLAAEGVNARQYCAPGWTGAWNPQPPPRRLSDLHRRSDSSNQSCQGRAAATIGRLARTRWPTELRAKRHRRDIAPTMLLNLLATRGRTSAAHPTRLSARRRLTLRGRQGTLRGDSSRLVTRCPRLHG